MASKFRMQIVDTVSGHVVEFEPGRQVECDLVDDCVQAIIARGVGLGRTSAHVAQDIRDGIEEAILTLKKKING